MKIILLVQFAKKTGGMMQSLWSLVNGLSKDPFFDVHIIMPNGADFCDRPFEGEVTTYYTKTSSWTINKSKIFETFKVACDIYKQTKHLLPDAVFMSNDVGGSILISLFPTFKKNNEVYVCRGGNFHGQGLGGWFMRNKIRFNGVKHVVVTANHLLNMVKEFNKSVDVRIIHNGLSLPECEYKYQNIDTASLRISTIGYICDDKNQREGVHVIKHLRKNGINAVLNVWGEAGCKSDQEYLDYLKDYIEKQGLKEFVNFKGFVKGEQIFQETDILISFSRSEGFGRTLVEGMLRHKPVIAWRGAGGPIDITDDGKYCHLVDNNDYTDYCAVIRKIIDNQDYNKANVEDSYAYALDNFTESRMIDNYREYLKNIHKTI